MGYIALAAVFGIVFLQGSGAIPMSSVGGPMTIATVGFSAMLAVAIYEAWTMKRGVLGWIVNILVTFLGVSLVAPFGGMIVALILSPFMSGSSSLAAEGGAVMSIALAAMMVVIVLSAWGSIWVVNRWRDRPIPSGAVAPGAGN